MSTTPQEESPALELIRLLAQSEAGVREQENRYFADMKLNRSQFICLMALGNTDGLKMGEIARELLVTKGSITQLVKEMEINGYVTKARNPNNEREVIVRLTEKGENTFATAYPRRAELLKTLFGQILAPDEQATLLSLLRKLRDGLKAKESNRRSASSV